MNKPKNSLATFAWRLKNLRSRDHLSQEELAVKIRGLTDLKVNRTLVSKWETGFHEPGIEALLAMARIFDVHLEYLTGRSNDLGTSGLPNGIPDAKWDGTLQSLRDDERIMLSTYRELNDDDRRFLQRQIELLRKERERGDA